MTAAKIMDIISRLPGCDGQAADAGSAFTHVKMEDAHKLLKNSKIGVSRHLDSSTTTQMAKIMVQYGRSSRSSWKEFVRSSFGRTILGKAIWENPIETWLGEIPNWECLFVHREKGLFLSVYVDDIKIGWKETKSWSDVENDQFSALQIWNWNSNWVREPRRFSFLQEEQIPQTSTSVVAARSKAKAKPQPRGSTGTTATIPIHRRKWIDIVPSKQDLDSYDLSKKVINLLRHNQTLQREEDGAIQFYKIKFHLRDHHSQIQNWSNDRWKACLAAGGGSRRRCQYCSDNSGTILYLRALQGHSGHNLIDPTLQDNVLIGPGIFPYIYHMGSNFNLHSIVNNGLILGGQNLSRRQSVFYLPVDPRKEDHKDPEYIDYSAPRLARYLQNAWKRHQDTVFWVDIDLGIREGLMFYQTRSNAIILHGTLPAHCILKVERLKIGEVLYEKQYLSPRPPPKNSFNSHLEKHFNLVLPSQPNSLNPLKIERGNPLPKRLLVSCKKNLVLPIDRGNPIERKKNASWKITIDRGNPIERKDCTKCKKMVISKIVMTRISSTLRWTTRTLISTSPVFPMRRWNALKALTFMTWFRESKVIHKKKQHRMISNNINHSIPSATSQKMR